MSIIKSLVKETAIYGLSYSLSRVINFLLITTYLTHRVFINQDGYFAIYQDIYFYIGLFLGILTLRMETTFFRFVSDEKYEKKIYPLASQMVWSASLIFLIICFIFFDSIKGFLKYPHLEKHIIIGLFIIVLDVIASLPFSKLRFKQQARKYAWIKLASVICNILLILFVFEGIGIIQPEFRPSDQLSSDKLYYILLANLCSSLLTIFQLRHELYESFLKVDWTMAGLVLKYSWPLIIVTTSYSIILNGYTSFLKYLLPGTTIDNLSNSDGYAAAVRLAVIMNLFVTAFNYAAEPFFFRHAKNKQAPELYAKVSLYFVITCCFIYLFTCLYIDVFAQLLGPNYRGSIHLVSILLIANIFSGIYTNFSSWYKLTDKTLTASIISLFGLLLNIILYILLIPRFGIDAAAWIACLTYLFITICSYVQGQKKFPIPYPLIRMSLYLISVIVMVFLLKEIYHLLQLSFIFSSFISIICIVFFSIYVYINEIKKVNLIF